MGKVFTLEDIKKSKVSHLNLHLFEQIEKQKVNKYKNQKIELDGFRFDSKKEARRYVELRTLATVREIFELRMQVVFHLSACKYIADFSYYTKAGEYVVEDVKGFRTREYKMKRKLMLLEKGIEIKET
jgi:peroxiredoxin family protein